MFVALTSRNKFITSIISETNELIIKTALGRTRKIDLSNYTLDILYYIDSDTNQIKNRKFTILNKDKKVIGYLFELIPDHIFIQIARVFIN